MFSALFLRCVEGGEPMPAFAKRPYEPDGPGCADALTLRSDHGMTAPEPFQRAELLAEEFVEWACHRRSATQQGRDAWHFRKNLMLELSG